MEDSAHVTYDAATVAAAMKSRLATKDAACRRLDLTRTDAADPLRRVYPWEYFVIRPEGSPDPSFVWCNVFKSGSSSWMYLVNRLGGAVDDVLHKSRTPLVTRARELFGRPSEEELVRAAGEAPVTFVIGRHPLERLVSAYKDKILGNLRHFLHIL